MSLRAATYLGDNTVALLDALVAHLNERGRGDGVRLAVDPGAGRDSADATARAGGLDLVWVCGHLGRRLLDGGRLRGDVVAAPVFEGETAPAYRSVLVARRDRPRPMVGRLDPPMDRLLAGRLAVNERESWSGHHAIRRHVAETAPGRWFARAIVSGSHRSSVEAVARGQADVAGIDSSVWRHLVATAPALVAPLEVVDVTRDWPAPPLVVGAEVDPDRRRAIVDGVLDFDASGIAGLERFVPAEVGDYDELA